MAKALKLKDNNYWDSKGITHKRTLLSTLLDALKTPSQLFPVGAVYITAVNTNPQTFLGGTWIAFGQGRTLVGVSTESEFNSVLKTGGEKTHKLTVNEMPSHNHPIIGGGEKLALTTGGSMYRLEYQANGLLEQVFSTNVGGDQAHNNLQPYITVYFWRRTA